MKDILELAKRSLVSNLLNKEERKENWIAKFKKISNDLFYKFDIDKSSSLSLEEILYLLTEIYKSSGIKNIPNE